MNPLTFYKCLADGTRLRCLILVQLHGELCVCELMNALDETQPKVSRHLAQLRKCGLLLDRRQGQWVFYRINPALPDWTKSILAMTAEQNRDFINKHNQRLTEKANRPEQQCCE
ncbi:Arsenical resistance operon repressor [Methylophaga frappieri]|uniref:Arsenical resistance operon repressor n=1 Tax=Methylophaga frappieri (strain ATCC BAA-2434 / DSM 25690 / JAM7) TaxID=754477 RepID=I1YJZ9_METFJ|nr:metalloregulator ArsR/SmtB family transcription factor [Methylophaga frappieri]AFJ03242.1 Arsenical resistance operon repressor [Methylophaga frappieri]